MIIEDMVFKNNSGLRDAGGLMLTDCTNSEIKSIKFIENTS